MADYHVSFPGLGISNLEINRVAFSLEIAGHNIEIYWYGIIIAFAFLLAMFLSIRQAKYYGLKANDIIDLFIVMIPAILIGARLYYVAFEWQEFKGDLLKIVNTRYGGMAFYGGIIGAVIAVYIYTKIKKIELSKLSDFLFVYLPLGQAIGRWGNFINQEAFGTNTDLPWGMISEGTKSYLASLGDQYAANSPVHPTFFYEFLGNMIIFAILLQVRRKQKIKLSCTATYFLLYGLLRFVVEGLRTDALMIGSSNIRVSQALSLVFILGGLIVLIWNYKKAKVENPLLAIFNEDAKASTEVVAELSTKIEEEQVEEKTKEKKQVKKEETGLKAEIFDED